MKKIILTVLATIFISGAVNASSYYNPYNGLYYGDICYTYYGTCVLPVYNLIGAVCFCSDGVITHRGVVGG